MQTDATCHSLLCNYYYSIRDIHLECLDLPRHENTGSLQLRTQRRRSTAQLMSAFVFSTRIVQLIFYLNPKFQASRHRLWLYSPVCVGPGRKPRRPVFLTTKPRSCAQFAPGCKFAPRVQICNPGVFLAM